MVNTIAKSKSGTLAAVIDLFHRRYAVPLIARLYEDRGAKFVTLVNHLGASRDTVSFTLRHLTERGLVKRNPGYGHPMRPEYVLTAAGERLGKSCKAIVTTTEQLDITSVAFKKWPVPVIAAIGQGADRFSLMLECLDGATPRALTSALRDLDRIEVVERVVTETWPPHPRYELAPPGQKLLRSVRGLVTILK